jgi:hypothetical protein
VVCVGEQNHDGLLVVNQTPAFAIAGLSVGIGWIDVEQSPPTPLIRQAIAK